MKRKLLYSLKIFSVCLVTGLLLVGGGYYYLQKSIAPAEIHTESIPYSFNNPENKGVMLEIGESKILFYLDFEEGNLKVIFPPEDFDENELYGYSVDFTVLADYTLLSAFIDYAGGIDLTIEDKALRYTGVQVTDILSKTIDTDDLKRQIITELFKKIGTNGIDEEAFWYIVENCETDLTVPDFYGWLRYIKKLCANCTIIN